MVKIEDFLKKEVDRGKTPSVQYMLFNKNEFIKHFMDGFVDVKEKKPVDESTIYQAFSITKTFTALCILQLVEDEKINIDDSVISYLPDFPYSKDITVRQLLSHSSGIPNPLPLNWIHLHDEPFNSKSFFQSVFKKSNKLNSLPNAKFQYSNLGYVLLSYIIENVSGLGYEEYVKTKVINKMGLNNADIDFSVTVMSRYAKGYQRNLSIMNLLFGFFIDKEKYMGKVEDSWKPFYPYKVNGAAYGGLFGTAQSFAKYGQELLKNDSILISPNYKKSLYEENYTQNGKPSGMCLSWFKGQLGKHTYYSHAGGGGGYYCEIRVYPEIGIGSVIFFNRTGVTDERFLDKVDKLYFEQNGLLV